VNYQPVTWQTLEPWAVAERYPTDASGRYPSTWVTTPLEPVVVRQDHPNGPTYQEAQGYTFLLFDPGFPRMARMPDGTIVLRMIQFMHYDSQPERSIKMFSYDEGRSWSDPVVDTVHAPSRGQLVPLGGQELMLYGHTLCHFSQDGGKTWDESIDVPALEGKYPWNQKGTILVEGDDITILEFGWPPGRSIHIPMLHRSHNRGRTWEKRVEVPEFIGSEGSIVRAEDGSLVAALRTSFTEKEDYIPTRGIPLLSDHWRGITAYRSTDNGKTWSGPQILNQYGYMHQELLVLENGDILMTYAARIGEVNGQTYHGIEAMLSHDNGQTWDWQNRFILFRDVANESMHSPISVQLSDGRILTVFMYHDPSRFWNDGPGIIALGHVSAVIWSPE